MIPKTQRTSQEWRPLNESPEDRQREETARAEVATRFGCEVVKLSETLYGLDWMMHRGRQIIGVGEFKAREEKYPTLHLGAAKWAKGLSLAQLLGVPLFIFVRWHGGPVHYFRTWPSCAATAGTPTVIYNRRGQRGDLEPGIAIDSTRFITLDKPWSGEQ